MRSNFDSPLTLTDTGVEACGELDWGGGETEVLVTITIAQRGAKIVGTASSPPSFTPSADEWMLDVRPTDAHKKFKKGPAHAVGIIHAMRGDTVDVFQWEQEVELDPDAIDAT
jgi:hypothetical protein